MVDLRVQEFGLLSLLKNLGGKVSINRLILESNLSDSAVMRSALELQEKNLITIYVEPHTIINLTSEGVVDAEDGLPERRLLNAIIELGGKIELKIAYEKSRLTSKFEKIALGC
ncbi:MAG: hypothetical protein AC479_05645 [miscellaneous Crenarchaeota group-6 archaeon AD8-1]|nr:MAG: hypothetical protein AC479_05645 [miscellaneous Crenarchaeota group-6 archaeon AD8-1]